MNRRQQAQAIADRVRQPEPRYACHRCGQATGNEPTTIIVDRRGAERLWATCSICAGATLADLIADVLHLRRDDPAPAEMVANGTTLTFHARRWDTTPTTAVEPWGWINRDTLTDDHEQATQTIAGRTRDKPCPCCGRVTLSPGEFWKGRYTQDGFCSTCGLIRYQWANLGITVADVAVARLLGVDGVAAGMAKHVAFAGLAPTAKVAHHEGTPFWFVTDQTIEQWRQRMHGAYRVGAPGTPRLPWVAHE